MSVGDTRSTDPHTHSLRYKIETSITLLINRHKFLIFTLSILSFVCFVYIYFAITLDEFSLKCLSLKGEEWMHCKVINSRDGKSVKNHSDTAHRLLFSRDHHDLFYARLKSLKLCSSKDEKLNTPCVVSFSASDSNPNTLCRSDGMPNRLCISSTPHNYSSPFSTSHGNKISKSSQSIQILHQEEDASFRSFEEAQLLKDLDFLFFSKSTKWKNVKFVLNIGGSKAMASYFSFKKCSVLSIPAEFSPSSYIENLLNNGHAAISLPFTNKIYKKETFPLTQNSFHFIMCMPDCNWSHETSWKLLQVDRLLIPGGYFFLPESCWQKGNENQKNKFKPLIRKMCWKKVQSSKSFTLWKKRASKDECWKRNLKKNLKKKSKNNLNPISKSKSEFHSISKLKALELINEFRLAAKSKFIFDDQKSNVRNILNIVSRKKSSEKSFKLDGDGDNGAWVMNVVSPFNDRDPLLPSPLPSPPPPKSSPLVIHDWCKGFPTPSRSYDFIYVQSVFSEHADSCHLMHILVELDRILRPGGKIIIRDSPQMIMQLKSMSDTLLWKSWVHASNALFVSKESFPNDQSAL